MTTDHTPKIRAPFMNRMRARRDRLLWRMHRFQFPVLKRLLDLMLVLPALIMLLPLFVIVALCIWVYDRGPVLYWQERVGLNGVVFKFPKFRSMCTDAEKVLAKLVASNQHGSSGKTFKMRRDPRITPVGRIIRRTSIDELPQLLCVLNGSMSLVGPRPPLVSEVAKYSLKDRERLSVKPGLTCIWQVNGRSEIPFDGQWLMDIDYIQNQSVMSDVKLIAKTIPAVIRGRGAY